MKADFIFKEVRDMDFNYLVVPSSYNSSINLIISNLKEMDLNDGRILIDQLVVKGDNSKRYLLIEIDDNEIDLTKSKYLTDNEKISLMTYQLLSTLSIPAINNIHPRMVRKKILSFKESSENSEPRLYGSQGITNKISFSN